MTVALLTKKQVKQVYKTYLIKHFPKDEVKPLSAILRAMKRGNYLCYGLMEGNDILCYGFLVKRQEDYLLDYLASREDMRSRGLGAEFLKRLPELLPEGESLLVEVEDPAFGQSPEEQALRTRRVNFYLRNGLLNTGARGRTFGVEFLLLELVLKEPHTPEQIRHLYLGHYETLLPPRVFRKMVSVG